MEAGMVYAYRFLRTFRQELEGTGFYDLESSIYPISAS
jgi:hypothetical protein